MWDFFYLQVTPLLPFNVVEDQSLGIGNKVSSYKVVS